jgi:hypothetical protein
VSDDISGSIELCSADTDYTTADPGGLTIGTAGRRTVLSQVSASLDNINDLPIVRLVFDYQIVKVDPTATFTAQLVPDTYETETLWSVSTNTATDWQHVVIDLRDYTTGYPSIEFELDNDVGGTAQVSVRRVHLYVRSYATLQATIQNQSGQSVTTGWFTVLSKAGERVRSQKVDRHGRITLLQIPGSRPSYRLRFSYQGRHYYLRQRFRYGEDHSDTFTFKKHSLQII